MDTKRVVTVAHSQFLHGWLTSIALHGLLLCAAILSIRQSPITLPSERFQWDVALVQSTQISQGAVAPTHATAQPIQETPAPLSTSAYRSHPTASPSTARAKTIQPMADHESTRATSPNTSSSTLQTASPVESTIIAPTPIPSPTAVEPSQPAIAQADSNPLESPVNETATASTNTVSDPLPHPADTSATPVTTATPVEAVSAPKSDYRWLQQAIFQKLDELKRSSHPQLDGLQPLKVLVKAVVSDEGMLLESEVVKSSGLDRIDQEAMALVRRAFPMQFERTIDRRQIVMRIPISYSRD